MHVGFRWICPFLNSAFFQAAGGFSCGLSVRLSWRVPEEAMGFLCVCAAGSCEETSSNACNIRKIVKGWRGPILVLLANRSKS